MHVYNNQTNSNNIWLSILFWLLQIVDISVF